MTYSEITKGMRVYDPLAHFGFGDVVRVCKKTVWVQFVEHDKGFPTIYDLEHLQFLSKVDQN